MTTRISQAELTRYRESFAGSDPVVDDLLKALLAEREAYNELAARVTQTVSVPDAEFAGAWARVVDMAATRRAEVCE